MTDHENSKRSEGKVPLFNAPVSAFIIPLLIFGLAFLQFMAPDATRQMIVDAFGLNPVLLRTGRVELLVSYAFVHLGIVAAALNALLILAFSVPLIRAFGSGAGGFASYATFVLTCSIVAGLIHCLIYMYDNQTLIGASGLMSGLLGAVARFPGFKTGTGRLNGLLTPQVLVMTLAWCGFNIIQAIGGNGSDEMAWQGHIAGYFAGLLLIGPWLRFSNPIYFTTK